MRLMIDKHHRLMADLDSAMYATDDPEASNAFFKQHLHHAFQAKRLQDDYNRLAASINLPPLVDYLPQNQTFKQQ